MIQGLSKWAKSLLTPKSTGQPFERLPPIGDPANPFIRDGGKTYMRFDEIVVSVPNSKNPQNHKVTFRWGGADIFQMSAFANLKSGDCLRLRGIEARMEYQLEE